MPGLHLAWSVGGLFQRYIFFILDFFSLFPFMYSTYIGNSGSPLTFCSLYVRDTSYLLKMTMPPCIAGSVTKTIAAHVQGLCSACAPGRFVASPGQTSCDACPAAKASHGEDVDGVGRIALADANAYGATTCRDCRSGVERGGAALCVDDACGADGAPCVWHVDRSVFAAATAATTSVNVLSHLDARGGERIVFAGSGLFNESLVRDIIAVSGAQYDANGFVRLAASEARTLLAVTVGNASCDEIAVSPNAFSQPMPQRVSCEAPCAPDYRGALLPLHVARLDAVNATSATRNASAWVQYRRWRNASAASPCARPPRLLRIEAVGGGVDPHAAYEGDHVALIGANFGPNFLVDDGGVGVAMNVALLVDTFAFDLRGAALGVVQWKSPGRIELDLPRLTGCGFSNRELPVALRFASGSGSASSGVTTANEGIASNLIYLDEVLARTKAPRDLHVHIAAAGDALELSWTLPPVANLDAWDAVHVHATQSLDLSSLTARFVDHCALRLRFAVCLPSRSRSLSQSRSLARSLSHSLSAHSPPPPFLSAHHSTFSQLEDGTSHVHIALSNASTSYTLAVPRGSSWTIAVSVALPGRHFATIPVHATAAMAPLAPTSLSVSFASYESGESSGEGTSAMGFYDAVLRWGVGVNANRGAPATAYEIAWSVEDAGASALALGAVNGSKRVAASAVLTQAGGRQAELVARLIPRVPYRFSVVAIASVPSGVHPISVELASAPAVAPNLFRAQTPEPPHGIVAAFVGAVANGSALNDRFQLDLRWKPPLDDGSAAITAWEVRLTLSGAPPAVYTSVMQSTATSIVAEQLLPLGREACAHVAATNALGTGRWSDEVVCFAPEKQRLALEALCAEAGLFYLTLARGKADCLRCPSKATRSCRDGLLALAPNVWFAGDAPTDATPIWACFNENACIANDAALRVECNRERGYSGALCGGCDIDAGWMRSGRSCRRCWSAAWNWAVVGMTLLFMFCVSIYMVAFYKFHDKLDDFSGAVRKQLISFLQMLGVLGIFRAHGTQMFNEAISRPAEIAGGSIVSLLPFKCAVRSQIWGPFLANIALPPLALIGSVAIAVPTTLGFRCAERRRASVTAPPPPPETKPVASWLPLPLHRLVCCARFRVVTSAVERVAWSEAEAKASLVRFDPVARLQGLLAFVGYGLYPTLVASTMSIFHCSDQIDGAAYLVADMTVKCWEGAHIGFVVLATISFIVYCLGIPLIVGAVVALRSPPGCPRNPRCFNLHCRRFARRTSAQYTSQHVRVRFGFLYHGYRTDGGRLLLVMWEVLVMCVSLDFF